jgi:hypothetical protein
MLRAALLAFLTGIQRCLLLTKTGIGSAIVFWN